MGLKDYIVDQYLTWRTGKDKALRDWEAWYYANVNHRAGDITYMFEKFKHVIVVDHNKFFDPYEPMAWVPCSDAEQYCHPNRALGECIVWRFERVTWDQWDERWHLDDFSGEDKVFVATNSDSDALMISLKYA
jgi:hypothetical protein